MNFRTDLTALLLCGSLPAQMVPVKPSGGGELMIQGVPYTLDLTTLSSAPPKGGLSGAIRLEGELLPKDGSAPFHLALTLLKDGTFYQLRIERQTTPPLTDHWAATLKTRIKVRSLADRPGGRVELRCEGPLTGIITQHPQDTTWSGTLWGVFPQPNPELR